jgi:hypothetical protein
MTTEETILVYLQDHRRRGGEEKRTQTKTAEVDSKQLPVVV